MQRVRPELQDVGAAGRQVQGHVRAKRVHQPPQRVADQRVLQRQQLGPGAQLWSVGAARAAVQGQQRRGWRCLSAPLSSLRTDWLTASGPQRTLLLSSYMT